MIKKRGITKKLLLFLMILIVIHMAYHLFVFGTGFSGFYEGGISGFSIGKIPLGEELRANYQTASPVSMMLIFAEWVGLVAVLIFVFFRNRRDVKKEVEDVKMPQKLKGGNKSTELDTLYDILKDKKHLRISSIMALFKLDRKTALEWAKTLEYGGLVVIDYPRFGEPVVILNE